MDFMDSVAYLYFMNHNVFDEMVKTKEFNIGKKSTEVFDTDSKGRRIFKADYSHNNIYYYRTESSCRESLASSIEKNRDKITTLFHHHPSMTGHTMKTFLRLNTKHYFSDSYKAVQVKKTLENIFQTGKNGIGIIGLGSCVGIDYYNYPTVPVVSLLSLILRDYAHFITNNKDATVDDLIKAILSYKVYKNHSGVDLTNKYTSSSAFFNAFAVYLLVKHPALFINYSYTDYACNGVVSWLKYLMTETKETVKRVRAFITEYDCSYITESMTCLSGYAYSSKCGFMKELEMLENFYKERDGKQYV